MVKSEPDPTASEAERRPRHVLLCVAGLTPQIITETLYVLICLRGEPVDEVRVITTLGGKKRIMEVLLDPQQGKFFQFCQDFGIDHRHIKFDETTIALLHSPDHLTLADIRTAAENEYAGDQICEFVHALTQEPDTRIHASAAGGRKTMSIYLTAAMQLFGRAQDCLSHVLVSEAFETHPDFFYVPPQPQTLEVRDRAGHTRRLSTAEAEVHLAEIPYIRLRGLRLGRTAQSDARSYVEMVAAAQADLDYLESKYDLQINLADNTLRVKERVVTLTPREMFFYALFADRHARGDGPLALDRVTRAHLDGVFRLVMRAQGDNVGIEEWSSFDEYEFLGPVLDLLSGRDAEGLLAFKEKFLQINARINARLKRAGLEHYAVALRDERGTARYGLEVAPERVKFITQAAG